MSLALDKLRVAAELVVEEYARFMEDVDFTCDTQSLSDAVGAMGAEIDDSRVCKWRYVGGSPNRVCVRDCGPPDALCLRTSGQCSRCGRNILIVEVME